MLSDMAKSKDDVNADQKFGCDKAPHSGNANDSLKRKGLVVRLVARWRCMSIYGDLLMFCSSEVCRTRSTLISDGRGHERVKNRRGQRTDSR